MKALSKPKAPSANNKAGDSYLTIFCCAVFIILLSCQFYAIGKEGKSSKTPAVPPPGRLLFDSAATRGYVLLAPKDSTTTFLIDKQGNVQRRWHSQLTPGMSVYLDTVGNLYRAENILPNYCHYPGGRIAMYSWNDTLMWADTIWSPTYQQCHDIYPMPNGHVLAAVWELIPKSTVLAAGRKNFFSDPIPDSGIWSAMVVELQPNYATKTADSIWSWHFWDHLDSTGTSAQTLNVNDTGTPMTVGGMGDWIHLNAVTYNEQLDQIILSSRNLNEIYIIQHGTSTATSAGPAGNFLYRWGNAAAYGTPNATQQLFGQHSPYWIEAGCPNAGQIMINNDGFGRKPTKFTAVNIINPGMSGGVYTGPPYTPATSAPVDTVPPQFNSYTRGSAQQLPNGNLIICAANVDAFYEVTGTPPHTMVWAYTLHDTGASSQANMSGAFRCHQYSEAYVKSIRNYRDSIAGKRMRPRRK